MAKKTTTQSVRTFDVAFGDCSIGDKTARITCSIDRSAISLNKFDDELCDKRLTGHLEQKPQDEAEGQGRLDGMDDLGVTEMTGTFDLKGFRVSKKHIAFGLTFALASVEIGTLAAFAKRHGKLTILAAAAIPDGSDEGPEDNGND